MARVPQRVAIAGGGPAGATLATFCARSGHDVVVYEKEAAPLPAVGESLLPFGNRVLQELGLSMEGFVRKTGALFVRGDRRVRFDLSQAERSRWTGAHQVPRAKFDARLRALAAEAGATFVFEERKEAPAGFDWTIDATGQRRAWGRAWTTYESHRELRNAAVSRHVEADIPIAGAEPGDVVIYALEGAWLWVIPLGAGKTSVGLVTTPARKGLKWDEAISQCPDLMRVGAALRDGGSLFGHRDFTEYAQSLVGEGWGLVGDAALFLDPVFSSGVLFALESAHRMSRVIDGELSPEDYEQQLRSAAALMEPLVRGFYSGDFFDLALLEDKDRDPAIVSGIVSLLAGDIFDGGSRMAQVTSRRLGDLAARVRRGGLV